jgi:hypothetical protein
MEKIVSFAQLQPLLNSSQTVFILLSQKLNLDSVAAGLSLLLSLEKAGKKTSIFCSRPMTVEFSSLVGVDRVKNQLEGKNLVISFDYIEDSVEKVSYNIENNKFNLVIQPKEGYPPLSPQKVQYFYAGANADLFLLIGTNLLEDLGEIYQSNKKALDEGRLISFDIQSFQSSGWCELIANLIEKLNLPIDEDIATNLLVGIEKETNSFSPEKSGPGSFEAAAFCLRAGGQRIKRGVFQPIGEKRNLEKKPQEVKKEKLPSEWLAPKIYKGNTLV